MVDVTQADREAGRHIETLEWLATQYLPGGPRDVKGAIRFATDAARHRTEAVKPLVEALEDVWKAAKFAAAMSDPDEQRPWEMIMGRIGAALAIREVKP